MDIQYALVYKYQPVYNRILVSTFCDILIEDSSSLIMMKDSAVFLKIYIHCQLKEDHHTIAVQRATQSHDYLIQGFELAGVVV